MELCAEFRFIVGWEVDFLNQFMFAMGERALILKLTFSTDLPVSTHLCLLFHLVLPDEIISLLFALEVLLWLLECCEFDFFVRTPLLQFRIFSSFVILRFSFNSRFDDFLIIPCILHLLTSVCLSRHVRLIVFRGVFPGALPYFRHFQEVLVFLACFFTKIFQIRTNLVGGFI